MSRLYCAVLYCLLWLQAGYPFAVFAAFPDYNQSVSVSVSEFQTREPSLTRPGRPLVVEAFLFNSGEAATEFQAVLVVPTGVEITGTAEQTVTLQPDAGRLVEWTVSGTRPQYAELRLELRFDGIPWAIRRLPIRFLEPRAVEPKEVIPAPVVPKKTSNILVGAHNCPLWSQENYRLWSQLGKHPERTPALGFYAQEDPEVADWETKWAAEHGIDFFIYCWYRSEQGGAVKTRHESALTDALFQSRYKNQIKIALMWENQSRGRAGVADEKDLLENLFPYWLNVYFKRENYLKIDNKPVLYIYRPEFLVQDLGSEEKVRSAMDKLRKAARDAGFDGLWLLGEYRGSDPNVLSRFKNLGLDYSFAYCWPLSGSPAPHEAINRQLSAIKTLDRNGILPQSVTVSQAWSGWRDEGSLWKLPPEEFEVLLRRAKAYIESRPEDPIASRTIILDNWNEWGEGHYLAPYTEYGFGYLDAIARVFTEGNAHDNLLPADIGKGGYDAPYRKWLVEQRKNWIFNPRWDFEDNTPQGWSAMMGLGKFETKEGTLIVKSTTRDPAMCIAIPNGFRANRFKRVRVRMQLTGLDNRPSNAQLYWIHDRSEDWSEANGVSVPLIQDSAAHDYVFEVSQNQKWNESITGLRLDFSSLTNVEAKIGEIVLEP